MQESNQSASKKQTKTKLTETKIESKQLSSIETYNHSECVHIKMPQNEVKQGEQQLSSRGNAEFFNDVSGTLIELEESSAHSKNDACACVDFDIL
jgi:hypothetical protein